MLLNQKIEEIFHLRRWAENADELILEISTGVLGDPILALANYLSHEDEYFQTYALGVMMELDSKRSVTYVNKLIQNTDWQFHICELIFRYGGTKEVLPQVVEILKNSESAGTRGMAARALGRIGDKNTINVLQYVQRNDHELDAGGWSVGSAAEKAIMKIQLEIENV